MKQLTILIFTMLSFASCQARDTYNHDSISSIAESSHATVKSPEIPDFIEFAGEKINLKRCDIRERLDREIISFCYMHSNSLLIMKRANRYLPEVERILKEENIPDDFKYLMIIESNVDPLARSAAGAAGFWQFMETTGREYGLEVNSSIDERYNVELATHAACRYLRDAYKKFGNWVSVAASYNAGQGRIANELTNQMEENALDLHLVTETSRYVFRIIAAKLLFANPQAYGFDIRADQLYPPYEYNEVTVNQQIDTLAVWAKTQGISYAQLKMLNPWLRGKSLPNKSHKQYKIRVITQESLYYDPKETKNNIINR